MSIEKELEKQGYTLADVDHDDGDWEQVWFNRDALMAIRIGYIRLEKVGR